MIWEPFFRFYGNLGHPVLAPAWPGLEKSIAALRRDPSRVAAINLRGLLAHYVEIVHGLAEPPVIIGHCYGGLIAQLLGDLGLGAAVVAIAPIPAKGFRLRSLCTRVMLLSVLVGASRESKACRLTFAQFRRTFGNTLPESGARQVYEAQVIPAGRRLMRQTALAGFMPAGTITVVDGAQHRRPPLLVIGGGADALVSGALCRAIARRQRDPSRIAEYKEFPGRSHLLIAEQGWQEVADHALTWALVHVPA